VREGARNIFEKFLAPFPACGTFSGFRDPAESRAVNSTPCPRGVRVPRRSPRCREMLRCPTME
jgi:hypothetical protein